MFCTLGETQFDVKFILFGIPIRVHPFFWLSMALLGQNMYDDIYTFSIWMICGFVSILFHELGHALAYRIYGRRSYVLMQILGGVTLSEYQLHSAWRRLFVVLAGPIVTFGIALAAYLALKFYRGDIQNIYLLYALIVLYAINLIWGIINILPIWPMDGGQALGEILILIKARYPEIKMHTISIVVAGFLVVYGLLTQARMRFPAIEEIIPFRPSMMFCFFMAYDIYNNWIMLQQYKHRRVYYDDADVPPWRR